MKDVLIDLVVMHIHDAIAGYAREFLNEANSILSENRVDLFTEPSKTFRQDLANESMRTFFVENSADKASMSAEEYEDHIEMMNEMYENDREAVLEHSAMGQYNPVIGMTFPIHKNIMMNNIFLIRVLFLSLLLHLLSSQFLWKLVG